MSALKNILLPALALFFLPSLAFPDNLTIEQVIAEVAGNSDSVHMMQESKIKSKQMIREKKAAAYPNISASLFAGSFYGLLSAASRGGTTPLGSGGISNVSPFSLQVNALSSELSKKAELTPADREEIAGMIGQSSQNASAQKSTNIYSSSIQVSQPIYTFGKIGTALKAAKEYDSATSFTFDRNLQRLQLHAFNTFYQVILAEFSLEIEKTAMIRKHDLYEFLVRNFELGSGGKAEILSAQADIKSQSTAIIRANNGLHNAKMNLLSLMGRALDDTVELDTISMLPSLTSTVSINRKTACEQALAKRGDFHSVAQLIDANERAAKIYKAMYLPSIEGIAEIGTGGPNPENLIQWSARNWAVGATLQWTLFDGFSNAAKSAQYRSDSRKLRSAQNSLMKAIEIEIDSLHLECEAADSNYQAVKEIVAANLEGYSLRNKNFRQGSGQFTDLELASDRLQQSELNLHRARYEVLKSRAELLTAMGEYIVNPEK